MVRWAFSSSPYASRLRLQNNDYSAWSYIEALEGLLESYQPRRLFQQDNAKIHMALASQKWSEEYGIWVIDWPAHSPDMNPIEHVSRAMKAILHRQHPDIHLLKNNREDVGIFKGWIREAWEAVPQ